jgi:DNA (cytosine-5)-methyltransferase 1
MTARVKPLLLDLFCGAGGAANGYHRAGFDVVGVDIRPQPNYPFTFHQGDALQYLAERGHEYDAIHASPPCQHYCNVTAWRGDQSDHPDLIPATRAALIASGLPWIIENVPEAGLRPDYLLCGSMFGLNVRRHRAFETSWAGHQFTSPCSHHRGLLPFMHKGERAYADAMECVWMTSVEAREAIPPAYTAYLGQELLTAYEMAA